MPKPLPWGESDMHSWAGWLCAQNGTLIFFCFLKINPVTRSLITLSIVPETNGFVTWALEA